MAIDYNRPFAWTSRQWKLLADFELYVAGQDMRWARAVCLHHTWKPVPSTWRGQATMNAMKKTFLTNENGTWDSGPHLFLALGSPDPANDGIWQGTPLNRHGIAAGKCNSYAIMIEVVGNYDDVPWPDPVEELVHAVVLILMRKIRQPVNEGTLLGHRECLPNKSCPGTSIDMHQVRREAARRLSAPVPSPVSPGPPGTFGVDQRFVTAWRSSGGIWRGPGLLAPGYARSAAFQIGLNRYQDFERGTARLKPDGSVEWLFAGEQPS